MKFFSNISNQYDSLWKAIIRPPRDSYSPEDLGPFLFQIDGKVVERTDVEITNPRGLKLKCSHFEPIRDHRVAKDLPCVIYLHGNCSSRLEAFATIPILLNSNITLFCFDFSGSGLSEGEYVSLGFFERDDLSCVVDYLRNLNTVSFIGLWGRSMGAATALLHGDRDPSIAAMVLDSPFSDLRVLAEELVGDFVSSKVPKFAVGLGLWIIRSSIKSRAHFDINDLSPISHVGQTFIPALFAAGEHDTFINPDHAKRMHANYAGEKKLIIVPGEHNSPRPQFFLDSVAIFFFNTLNCAALPHREAKPLPGVPTFGGLARGIRGMGVAGAPSIAEELDENDEQLQRAIAASLAAAPGLGT